MTRDLRKYTRQTNTRLIIGGVLLLFIVVHTRTGANPKIPTGDLQKRTFHPFIE